MDTQQPIPPRLAKLRLGTETYIGVLDDREPLYALRVVKLTPQQPMGDGMYGVVEMEYLPARLRFNPETAVWREIDADEFWSTVRAMARGVKV